MKEELTQLVHQALDSLVAQGQLPESPDACDAYVVTGSPKGVYDDDPWIADLAQFLSGARIVEVMLSCPDPPSRVEVIVVLSFSPSDS